MSKQQPLAVPAYTEVNPQAYPQAYPQANPQAFQQVPPQALPGQFPDSAYAPQQPPPSYQQHYQPQLQQQTQVVHTIIHQAILGPETTITNCHNCHKVVGTRVDYATSSRTHLMAGLLCLFCWPLFWIPYTCESCQSANHFCPHCNAFIGSYNK